MEYFNLHLGGLVVSDLHFKTLADACRAWSVHVHDDTIKYAWISRYTDEETPGVCIMDLHFNELESKAYNKPYITLK